MTAASPSVVPARADSPGPGTIDQIDQITALGKAVGDPLRAGILQALKEDSFAVSELCELFGVAQPALSHHLKILFRAGLVARRREGNNIFYRRDPATNTDLKAAIYAALDRASPAPALLAAMLKIHHQRQQTSQAFFAAHASEVASEQRQLADPAAYTDTVIEMIEQAAISARTSSGKRAQTTSTGKALEIGPGDGHLLGWLAAHFDSATAIDSSPQMLARAAHGTARFSNLTLRHADFGELAADGSWRLIVASMVVHHMPSPARFFQHAAQLLTPDGSLLIAELCRHEQQNASTLCGDLWLGFEPRELASWAENAGLRSNAAQFLAQKNGFQIQIQRYEHA